MKYALLILVLSLNVFAKDLPKPAKAQAKMAVKKKAQPSRCNKKLPIALKKHLHCPGF